MLENSFKNIDEALSYLENVNEDERYQVISNLYDQKKYALVSKAVKLLKTDENKLKIAKRLYDDKFEFELKDIADNMESDDYKLEVMDLLIKSNDRIDAINIAIDLKNDISKLKAIDKLNSINYMIGSTNVAVTLKDDYYKQQYSNKLLKSKAFIHLSKVASSINDDSIKRQILTEIGNIGDWNTYKQVAKSFVSDKYKLEAIDVILEKNKDYALSIGETLKEKDNRMIFFTKIFKYWHEAESFLNSLNDPKEYAECLRWLYTNDEIDKNYNHQFKKEVINNLMLIEREDYLKIYEELSDILSSYYSLKYALSKNGINYTIDNFGYDIYKHIDSKKLQKIINAPIEDITKIVNLVKTNFINYDDINNIYNSLLQQEFTIKNAHIRNIFAYFKDNINNNNLENLELEINNINSIIDFKQLLKDQRFLQELKINGYQLKETDNFKLFLNQLCISISSSLENNKKSELNLLNSITDFYIRTCRENHVKSGLLDDSKNLLLKHLPNKEKQLRKIFEKIDAKDIQNMLLDINTEKLDERVKSLLSNRVIIEECIKFKKDPKNYKEQVISKKDLTSKYLAVFNTLLSFAYEQKLLDKLYYDNDVLGTDFEIPEINYYDILCNIDYEQLKTHILNNEEMRIKTKQILDKYKVISWRDTFKPILEKLGYEVTNADLASLMNFADVITSRVSAKELTPIILLNEISLFSAKSSIYKTLFGNENYKYISNNSNPNASSMDKETRLRQAIKLYKDMYKRKKINIPSINEIIEVNGKKVRAIVGDVVNPINLTLGERTGSCMRIGGSGDSLLRHCCLKENGFHIRFEDADTNEFISRVSGFRNGNTVFLNELRNSKLKNVNDSELITVCTEFANILIKNTSKEDKKIDNVVISENYAMESLEKQVIPLNVDDIKEGMKYFYSDITNQGIVLASTNDKQLVPIKLYLDMPEYDVSRRKIEKYTSNTKACSSINKALLTEAVLNDINLSQVSIVDDADLSLVGEDWYIYLDSNQYVHGNIFKGITEERYEKALKEYDSAYKVVSLLSKDSEIEEIGEKTNAK